jgi:uncharacterized membrane protein YoaK (UPF0700 family)
MTNSAAVPRVVPALLSVLAGYVDSCTFLALFGLFVAHVTGSFVLFGTQFFADDPCRWVKLMPIPVFLLACIVTTLMVGIDPRRSRSALGTVLWVETALLAGLFIALLAGNPLRGPDTPVGLFASVCGIAAMGVQSALVRLTLDGPSTNVMTTNTTQLAIELTKLTLAWPAWRAQPANPTIAAELARARAQLNTLWPVVLGFLTGTIAGTFAYARFNLWCVLAPVALAGGLALWARAGQAPAFRTIPRLPAPRSKTLATQILP